MMPSTTVQMTKQQSKKFHGMFKDYPDVNRPVLPLTHTYSNYSSKPLLIGQKSSFKCSMLVELAQKGQATKLNNLLSKFNLHIKDKHSYPYFKLQIVKGAK